MELGPGSVWGRTWAVNRYDMTLEGDGGYELEGGWVRKPKKLVIRLGIRE